jgi:hypothetical protein
MKLRGQNSASGVRTVQNNMPMIQPGGQPMTSWANQERARATLRFLRVQTATRNTFREIVVPLGK